jgi:hypothetical protein
MPASHSVDSDGQKPHFGFPPPTDPAAPNFKRSKPCDRYGISSKRPPIGAALSVQIVVPGSSEKQTSLPVFEQFDQPANLRKNASSCWRFLVGEGLPNHPFCTILIMLEKSSPPCPARLCAAYRLRAMPPSGVAAFTAIAFSCAKPRSLSIRSVPNPPA